MGQRPEACEDGLCGACRRARPGIMLARAAIPSQMMHELAHIRRGSVISLAMAAWVGLAASVGLVGCASDTRQGQARQEASEPVHVSMGEESPATPTPTPTPTATPTPTPTPTATPPTAAGAGQPESGQAGQLAVESAAVESAMVDLAPKLVGGLIARYSVRAEGQEATELTGSMAARSESKWDATLDVLVQLGERNAEGLMTATISLDRVRATDWLDGRAAGYDSAEAIEKDPGNLVRPTIEGLVGKRIELDLDAHGRIVNARIPAELAKRFNPTTRWTTRLLGDAVLRTLFGPIFSTGIASGDSGEAASDRASVGQAWTTTRQEPFGSASVTTTIEHAMDSVSEGSATISLNGASAIAANASVPIGVQRITRDAFSGTTRWDLSRGLLAEHELGRETQVQVRPDPEGFSILKTLLVQVRRVD